MYLLHCFARALGLSWIVLILSVHCLVPKFLELYPVSKSGEIEFNANPVYLAYPDSLGNFDLVRYLASSEDSLQKMTASLEKLPQWDRQFIAVTRALSRGKLGPEQLKVLVSVTRNRPKGPMSDCLRLQLGTLWYLMGKRDNALQAFEESIHEKGVFREGAYRNLYSHFAREHNFIEANGILDKMLTDDPHNQFASIRKAYIISKTKGADLEAYLKSKSAWRDSAGPFQIAYGRYLLQQGDLDEAVRNFNRGLDSDPSNGQAWMELGGIYHRLGWQQYAEKCLLLAFKNGIRDMKIFDLFAEVMVSNEAFFDSSYGQQLGIGYRWDRVAELLSDGLKRAPERRVLAQKLYEIQMRSGQVKEAKKLRGLYWFHFDSPYPSLEATQLGFSKQQKGKKLNQLQIDFGPTAFPLFSFFTENDFFSPADTLQLFDRNK